MVGHGYCCIRKWHTFKETAVSSWVLYEWPGACWKQRSEHTVMELGHSSSCVLGVLISYPIRDLWPKHCHRAQWDVVSPNLQVLFASMAICDGVQFWKKSGGVFSLFWRVTGDGESHRGEEFSPPALSKTRCWELVTQVVIHALVSSCFRSSMLQLVEGREWSQQPVPEQAEGQRRKEEGLLFQLYREQQAGNSGCFQLVFTLPTALTWLSPAKGVKKPLFSVFLAWVSNVKGLFGFQIWKHSHTQGEIIRSLNCRRAQVELVGKWSGTAN